MACRGGQGPALRRAVRVRVQGVSGLVTPGQTGQSNGVAGGGGALVGNGSSDRVPGPAESMFQAISEGKVGVTAVPNLGRGLEAGSGGFRAGLTTQTRPAHGTGAQQGLHMTLRRDSFEPVQSFKGIEIPGLMLVQQFVSEAQASRVIPGKRCRAQGFQGLRHGPGVSFDCFGLD
jgi:hypothetical protein